MKHAKRMPKRFLEGAPDHVADIFDSPQYADRFTVFYREIAESHGRESVGYRGMSENPSHPQGVGMFGEMAPHEFSAYRAANRRRRIKWADLPPAVKACVMRDKPESARLVRLSHETFTRLSYALTSANDSLEHEAGYLESRSADPDQVKSNRDAIAANNRAADLLTAAWNKGKPA